MTEEVLLAAFESGAVPPGGFHHAQHVQVAWAYVRREPLAEALVRFTVNLKRFAAAQGAPGLYHETITVAFLLIISERLDATGRDVSWEAFAAANADLLTWAPSVLDRYYQPATLRSDRAKRTFVMPDLS